MAKSKPDLSDYVEVSERIQHFREQYPEGSLQAEVVELRDDLVVVKAYAYRTPDDNRPGTGLASEPIPGRTPYTKDSELMNAETSAWGRAIIAVGASDAKRGIASANEVRNRQSNGQHSAPAESPAQTIRQRIKAAGLTDAFVAFLDAQHGVSKLDELDDEALAKLLAATGTEAGLATIAEYGEAEAVDA